MTTWMLVAIGTGIFGLTLLVFALVITTYTYSVKVLCQNCGRSIRISIPRGELAVGHVVACNECGVAGVLVGHGDRYALLPDGRVLEPPTPRIPLPQEEVES